MRLRDICPCRIAKLPDVIMTTGMTLVCTEGHRIDVSFNYIPKEFDYDKRYQKSKWATEAEKKEKL